MSIPLIQDNQKDSINASLIAIKREEERLQALIAEADKKIAQLNELKVNKSDIVDEVTLNNMQSVTSNAVAEALSNYATTDSLAKLFEYIMFGVGKTVTFSGGAYACGIICATTANVGTGVYAFTQGGVLTKLAGQTTITLSYNSSMGIYTISGYGNNTTRVTVVKTKHP